MLDVLRYGVEYGFVSLPLSAVHYMETYRRPVGRQTLAAIMAELSRFHAIAGPPDVLPAELDTYLHKQYGKPREPQPLRVFGRGWAFAMGHAHTPPKASAGPSKSPGERWPYENAAGEFLELAMLAGPPDGVAIPGWAENDGYREFGERQVVHEQLLALELVEDGPASTKKIHDWVAATEINDIAESLTQAFKRAGITAAESPDLDTRKGLTMLLRNLPSRDVIFDLRRLRHADRRAQWKPNDLNDLGALSVALPYCDVVVTEKQWRHLAVQAGIPGRYDTVVLDSLKGLTACLL